MEQISVIVPVYNSEAYLEKCLNSIVNQTYPNLEIIIINDCSTDNSGEICKKFQHEYGNIKYFELEENRGVSHARNLGLENASGPLIGFVDSDDWAEKDMFQTLYETLTANNVPMAAANFRYIDYNTQKEINTEPDHKSNLRIDNTLDALLYTIGVRDNYLWNKLYKREVFEGIVFPEGKVYEDVDLIPSLIENAGQMAVTTKYIYNYQLQPESITRNMKMPQRFLDYLYAVIRRYEYLPGKYNSEKLEQLCRNHIFRTLMDLINNAKQINFASDERVTAEFAKVKNMVYDNYCYDNCGFSDAEKKLIESLKKSVMHYKITRDMLRS